MMKNLGCPFLLFSDPRIEGGAFYLGSEELENKVKETIQYYLDYLGLTSKDLILSGLSMGHFHRSTMELFLSHVQLLSVSH